MTHQQSVNTSRLFYPILWLLFVFFVRDLAVAESTWPQFRGPDGQGHSSSRGLPVTWNERTNVVWKTKVPGRGWSSPVVSDGRIWLTTCVEADQSLRVLWVDCERGRIRFNFALSQRQNLGLINPKNSHATPTLIVQGDRVYAHFGAHGTACLSVDGEVLWTRVLNYYHHHGPAASPVLVNDLLIIPCDGFSRPFYDHLVRPNVTDFQFVAALDTQTGRLRWKRARVGGRHSYATPLVINVDGQRQVVSPGGDGVTAYDPTDGHEIWSCRYTGYSVVPRPVYGHGLVFVCTGFDNPSLLAIRPNGHGDVTKTHVAWTTNRGVSLTPSPLLVDDELYLISDTVILSCFDAKSGRLYWKQRLGGNFSASPLWADGHIYLSSESGTTHVIVPGKKYRLLATNKLNGLILASMAVSDRSLYIRTDHYLYRIEERGVD